MTEQKTFGSPSLRLFLASSYQTARLALTSRWICTASPPTRSGKSSEPKWCPTTVSTPSITRSPSCSERRVHLDQQGNGVQGVDSVNKNTPPDLPSSLLPSSFFEKDTCMNPSSPPPTGCSSGARRAPVRCVRRQQQNVGPENPALRGPASRLPAHRPQDRGQLPHVSSHAVLQYRAEGLHSGRPQWYAPSPYPLSTLLSVLSSPTPVERLLKSSLIPLRPRS